MIRVWIRKDSATPLEWNRAEWDTETLKVTLFTKTGAIHRQPYRCSSVMIKEWFRKYSHTVDEVSHDVFIDTGL